MVTVCLLHPGAMGSSVGAAAKAGGHVVRWVARDRSAATRARAAADGLTETPTLASALVGAEVVASVCPPANALDVAEQVAAAGFRGLYVDMNAIAPATMRRVASIVGAGGATAVDGGLIGPPARRAGTTRLVLTGDGADDVARIFEGSLLEPVVIGEPLGAASATKVAYAAWTKGSAALLLAVAAYAEAEGVTAPLRDEWARSQPALADQLAATARATAPKGWRFAGEMAESARAFADAGLPAGFGGAAADIYAWLGALRDRDDADLAAVLAALAAARGRDGVSSP